MSNKNVEMIVRLSFANGSNEIHIGETVKGNATLTGKVMWVSGGLDVSVGQGSVERMGVEDAAGLTGVLVMPDLDAALDLALEINDVDRVGKGRKGGTVPFVFVRFRATEEIIFNAAEREGETNRITINEVNALDVEVVGITQPREVRSFRRPVVGGRRSPSLYGSRNLTRHTSVEDTKELVVSPAQARREARKAKVNAQTKAAKDSLNLMPAVREAAPNPNDARTQTLETSAQEIIDEQPRVGVDTAQQTQREIELAQQVESQSQEIAELKDLVKQLLTQSNNGAGALVTQ